MAVTIQIGRKKMTMKRRRKLTEPYFSGNRLKRTGMLVKIITMRCIFIICYFERLRVLQREKEISDSKRGLEQLLTQLDKSFTGSAISSVVENEEVKDPKLSQLESSLATMKSEKRELEMRLLSLETVKGMKLIVNYLCNCSI